MLSTVQFPIDVNVLKLKKSKYTKITKCMLVEETYSWERQTTSKSSIDGLIGHRNKRRGAPQGAI